MTCGRERETEKESGTKDSLHISTFEQLCVIRIQNFRGFENSAKTEFAVSTETPFILLSKCKIGSAKC